MEFIVSAIVFFNFYYILSLCMLNYSQLYQFSCCVSAGTSVQCFGIIHVLMEEKKSFQEIK